MEQTTGWAPDLAWPKASYCTSAYLPLGAGREGVGGHWCWPAMILLPLPLLAGWPWVSLLGLSEPEPVMGMLGARGFCDG